jgi:RNA-directed DNA polymerase
VVQISIALDNANSYGYRPERSAHDAIAMVRRRSWEYDWVVEFDIKGLFSPVQYRAQAVIPSTVS